MSNAEETIVIQDAWNHLNNAADYLETLGIKQWEKVMIGAIKDIATKI